MSSDESCKAVAFEEIDDWAVTPCNGWATCVWAEFGDVGAWIGPEEVCNGAFGGDCEWARDFFDLGKGFDFWSDSTVNAKETATDNGGEREVFKKVTKFWPEPGTEFFVALALEAEVGVHFWAFVVPTEEVNVHGVFDFESEKETENFDALGTAIDVVAQE